MELGIGGGVAIVTGGAAGIGRATAHVLAEEGVKVAILDRDSALAASGAEELVQKGASCIAITCDVADEESVKQAIKRVAAEWEAIDYLILCAGISGLYGKKIEEIEVSQWDTMMGVNVRGQWLCVKHALPYLRKSTRASVSIVASDSALRASPLHVPYCTSKGALLMLTKALSVDLRTDGIRVNCVCPSIVDTRQSRADVGLLESGFKGVDYPVMKPEDIARYLTILASPVAYSINAHALVADFGYAAQSLFPC
jgi:dihydroanticapsin dehydrogenase